MSGDLAGREGGRGGDRSTRMSTRERLTTIEVRTETTSMMRAFVAKTVNGVRPAQCQGIGGRRDRGTVAVLARLCAWDMFCVIGFIIAGLVTSRCSARRLVRETPVAF